MLTLARLPNAIVRQTVNAARINDFLEQGGFGPVEVS
jgi:hypothetical protein